MGFNLAYGIPDEILSATKPSLDVDETRAVWAVTVTITNYDEIKAAYEKQGKTPPEEESHFYWPVDDRNTGSRHKREAADFAKGVTAGQRIVG